MRLLFASVFTFAACTVFGQLTNPGMSNPSQWYINNQMYSTRVFNGMVANSMLRGKKGKVTKPLPTAAVKVSSFKETGSILPKLLATKFEPEQRAQAEKFFQSHLDLYRQTAAKDGFPANDLAYALEYFVVNNYHLYHGLIGAPNGVTMAQERAVYSQFKRMLASDADIKKMTDRQKQETTEVLAIMFGMNLQGYLVKDRSGGDKVYQQCREVARQGLEKLIGAKIEQIKITNKGVEI